MGAWGTGPLENDDALDFTSEISDIAALEAVMAEAEEADFIEADLASRCLVVAECVAASCGHPHAGIPEGLAATIAAFDPLPQILFERARAGVAQSGKGRPHVRRQTLSQPITLHDLRRSDRRG